MTCEFTHLDGAYVLGALGPAERREFEEHLAGCAECSRAVREIAGLPGLLARVDADVLTDPPREEPVPETLLPSLMTQVRRSRRRRTVTTAGLAAAAAVLVTVGAGVTVGLNGLAGGDGSPSANPPASSSGPAVPGGGTPMTPVVDTGMTANLALETVPWGTRLDLSCSYAAASVGYAEPAHEVYSLVVRTSDGHRERVATWHSLPGRTMQLAAATSTARADIASVEVRAADGRPVLRLTT